LIQEGFGTRFVGDSIASFQAGDLLFIGSNVPHWFRNDSIFFKKKSKRRARSISLFFKEDSLGTDFFQLPEMVQIREVLHKARRGILIKGNTKEKIILQLMAINQQPPVNRLLSLIQMLDQIAQSNEWAYLSKMEFDPFEKFSESEILNKIFQYVMANYEEPIHLETVAQANNMSVSTFCRYFKLRTQKTFIQFVNEIRIGAACKSFREEERNISEIAYQVGFNNISNFNRQFKMVTGCTPRGWIKQQTAPLR
jgi:AraC-like DNA-binding protein